MRGRTLARIAVAAQAILLAGALVVPGAAAAATLGFTLEAPSVSTVAYSDFVVLRGTYTCINDGVSNCPSTLQSRSATFSIRPSGGDTFTNVGTVSTSFNFTSDPAGCPSACSQSFQLTWKAGRALGATVSPGVYDVGLTSTISGGQLILLGGVTIVPESTITSYGGLTAGLGNTQLALSASVLDQDLGQLPGTGIFSPDPNLLGANLVSFELFDSSNTTSVAGPVSATLLGSGLTSGSPKLLLPQAGGTFKLRTTFVGNAFYATSSDLDTISVTPSNTAPVLNVPASPVVAEATSPAGAAVSFSVSATDAEDEPDPTPSCAPASGSVFALGDTTVNCSVTDSGGLSDTGSFTVRVVDTTNPSVSITTAESDNGAGWYNAASNDGTPGLTIDVSTGDLVGVASLVCTDDGADVGTLDRSGDSFVLGDGVHAISCTATDGAGNHASDSTTFKVDQTPPTIAASLSPDPDSGTGWWNSGTGAPTVTYLCGDTGSGLASCSPPHLFGEGAGQGDTGTAVDVAGNSSSASVANVNVDLTAPSISASIAPSADSVTGWWNIATGAPTVTYTCADTGGSGVSFCSAPYLFGEGAAQGATGSVVDVAGNSSSASVSGVNVDVTAPTSLAFVGGGLTSGAAYVFGSVPPGPTGCTASGGTSGLAGCFVTGYAAAVGAHVVTATATDGAGNTSSTGLRYTVLPWTLVGFANPISMTGLNQAKAGSTANLRFLVFAGATELTTVDAIAAFTQTQVSCATLAQVGPTTSALLAKGASLKYATQFQAKWDPPSMPNTCWAVAIVTADGSSLTATFQLK